MTSQDLHKLGKAQLYPRYGEGGKWVSETRRRMIRVTLGPLWVLTKLRFPVMVMRGAGVGIMA